MENNNENANVIDEEKKNVDLIDEELKEYTRRLKKKKRIESAMKERYISDEYWKYIHAFFGILLQFGLTYGCIWLLHNTLIIRNK